MLWFDDAAFQTTGPPTLVILLYSYMTLSYAGMQTVICIQIIQEYSQNQMPKAPLLTTAFQWHSPPDSPTSRFPREKAMITFSRAAADAIPSRRSRNTSQEGVQLPVL